MNPIGQRLTDLARTEGRRWYDPKTRLCVGARDTLWYAIALLHSPEAEERALGDALLGTAQSADGTHTPATMLAILLAIPDRISPVTAAHLEAEVRKSLPEAALAEWHDGNVNHPLAAWVALILAGERSGDAMAVSCGAGRLRSFARTVGNRRHARHRQATFSEYNSPTYTALDLWFLALAAEFTRDPALKRLALFLEQRLWIETALFFHAPSQQFSGPHCRAYLDDSLGGWSALHCALAVAANAPLLLEPQRSLGTNHPSAILENALVAITPFHFPDEARRLAFGKPLPCELRLTTYGESYHENHATRGFEDGVYPGGWSQLTSFQTAEFALGTASRPYVNAGHSDAFMARWRRRPVIGSVADMRSLFCRGVFNDAVVGQANRVHVTGGRTDESFLYEEGRTCTLQHRNRALVLYAPKAAGHLGVQRFRVDLMFSHDAPFDEFRIDGRPAAVADAVLPETAAAEGDAGQSGGGAVERVAAEVLAGVDPLPRRAARAVGGDTGDQFAQNRVGGCGINLVQGDDQPAGHGAPEGTVLVVPGWRGAGFPKSAEGAVRRHGANLSLAEDAAGLMERQQPAADRALGRGVEQALGDGERRTPDVVLAAESGRGEQHRLVVARAAEEDLSDGLAELGGDLTVTCRVGEPAHGFVERGQVVRGAVAQDRGKEQEAGLAHGVTETPVHPRASGRVLADDDPGGRIHGDGSKRLVADGQEWLLAPAGGQRGPQQLQGAGQLKMLADHLDEIERVVCRRQETILTFALVGSVGVGTGKPHRFSVNVDVIGDTEARDGHAVLQGKSLRARLRRRDQANPAFNFLRGDETVTEHHGGIANPERRVESAATRKVQPVAGGVGAGRDLPARFHRCARDRLPRDLAQDGVGGVQVDVVYRRGRAIGHSCGGEKM